MKNNLLLGLAGFVLLNLCSPTSANADFVVVIGSKTNQELSFVAGTTATIEVWGYNSGAPMSLAGYNLAFDFGNDGLGIPGVPDHFTNLTADFSGAVAPNSPFGQYSDPDSGDVDLFVGSGGSDYLLPTSLAGAVKLFDLKFDIATLTPGGVYSLTLDAGFSDIDGTATQFRNIAFENGSNMNSFRVTAVPEPTSLALMGAGLAGFVGSRRLKKRRAAEAKVAADAAG